MNKFLSWILKRAQEPSGYAGISGILTGIASILNGEKKLGTAAICLGIAAFLKPETSTTLAPSLEKKE